MNVKELMPGVGPWNTIAARVTTRTAIAPLIVLILIYACLLVPVLLAGDPSIALLMAYGFFGVLGLTAFAYLYFMFRDPDRLQSEDHQLAQQQLRNLAGRKFETLDGEGGVAPQLVIENRAAAGAGDKNGDE